MHALPQQLVHSTQTVRLLRIKQLNQTVLPV